MNLQPITMERYEARKLFLEYRRAVKTRHSDEDKQIMEGYRYLARGEQVINIQHVLRTGGFDTQGRPKLAICRAHAQVCYFRRAAYQSGVHVYHILWEADWEAAPVDPVLLKHIAGPLYAILAQWDLTPLERAVIEGRLQ